MNVGRILVTSVVREVGRLEKSGFVRVIDLSSGNVMMCSPMPQSRYRGADSNPRGGLRGARGACFYKDTLLLANTERIFMLDPGWGLIREISHPLMGGVHDILAEDDGIWVACTSTDLLIKLDWDGSLLHTWEWRRFSVLRDAFGFSRLAPVDHTLDYRDPENMRDGVRNTVHLNNLTAGQDGLWISFGRVLSAQQIRRRTVSAWIGKLARLVGIPSRREQPAEGRNSGPPSRIGGSSWAVVYLESGQSPVVKKQVRNTSVPNHNMFIADNTLTFNDTNRNLVVRTPLNGDGTDLEIPVPGSPGFLRGLLPTGSNRFLVGSQNPLAIYEVDFGRLSVTREIRLAGDARESVYGIYALPDHFDDPPETLGLEPGSKWEDAKDLP